MDLLFKIATTQLCIHILHDTNFFFPVPSFSEQNLSHQLQSGSKFNYKVAQLEKVAQKKYKVTHKLQSGAKITKYFGAGNSLINETSQIL